MRFAVRSRPMSLVLLTAGLGLAPGLASTATATEPMVHHVSPAVLEPSGSLTIEGTGFDSAPDHVAVLRDEATGEAALVDIVSADDSVLHGRLGPTSAAFDGTLTVSTGRHHQLPGSLREGMAGSLLTEDARWFVPSAAAVAPSTLEVPAPLEQDPCVLVTSRLSGGVAGDEGGGVSARRAPLPPVPCVIDGINIVLVVQGGGPGGTNDPGHSIARTIVTLLAPSPAADRSVLTREVADALNGTFGALGLQVGVDGDVLLFDWARGDGFVDLVTIRPVD